MVRNIYKVCTMYMSPPCVCPFMCISPPYVCSSMCMSLRVYDPSCALPLRMHVPSMYVPSMCISPPRIYPLRLRAYVPSAWCPLPVYVSLFDCSFMCTLPPCICPSVCTSLRVHVSSVCISTLCVCPSACMFLHMIVVGIRTLLEQQAGAAGQWGTQVNVCAQVSLVVGVHSVGYRGSRLCPCQLGHWGAVSGVPRLTSAPKSVGSLGYICSFVSCASVLLSLRVRFLSCHQLRVRLFFSCVSINARRDGT